MPEQGLAESIPTARPGGARGGTACSILIAHLSVGSGHRIAAEALAAAFGEQIPDAEAQIVDLLEQSDSWRLRRLPDVYGASLRLVPWAYDWFWHHSKPGPLNSFSEQASFGKAIRRFRDLLAETKPDVVVCTHGFAARLSARLRQEGMQFLHAAVITDFGCHWFWPREGIDLLITPTQQVATECALRGIPAERVHACGIPVRPAFWREAFAAEASRARGGATRPAVAVLAGGSDTKLYGASGKAARELIQAHAQDCSAFDLTVITGHDRPLRQQLAGMSAASNCGVLGYVTDMPALLGRANLLVTKPGGLATAEALACGVPLLYVGRPLGQERANVEFAVNNGAAVHAEQPSRAAPALESLLRNDGALRYMAEQARRLGRPRAALDAVGLIIRALEATAEHRGYSGVGEDLLERHSLLAARAGSEPTHSGRATGGRLWS